MRPRPQPNQRRGVLRAALAVIVLTALLIIAVAIAGVLHQPTKPAAPTPPPTVNLTPPKVQPTPKGTVKPTVAPKARAAPSAAAKKTPKTAALAPSQGSLFDRAFTGRRWPAGAVASPDGSLVAYFAGGRDAYALSPLVVVNRRTGVLRRVGAGDRFVRPVWSRGGRLLLYARVTPTSRTPGAMWRLVRTDTRTARNVILWRQAALEIQPLGWRGNRVLYSAAEETDTAIYAVRGRARSILGMLSSEPITNPVLSPSGRYIAFGAPTNCGFCTINIYDLDLQWDWGGPSGMPRETDLAWTANDTLVASLRKRLAIVGPNGYNPSTRYAPLPAGLPRVWSDPMRPAIVNGMLVITDSVTYRRYISR